MNERQLRFIKVLAKSLIKDEAKRSMLLRIGNKDAQDWADLRGTTPLFGYYPEPDGPERAEKELIQFLWPQE
jgi:hypothetical protein